jgi:uncharacterized protein involved in exopolysaccharide biosynthesis
VKRKFKEVLMAQDIIPAGSFYPVRSQEENLGWKATKQLFFVIFKWQRLILSLFLAFAVAAGIALLLKPPVRTATTKILLKADRVPLQISGLSNLSGKVAYSPQIMQSEVEVFMSREVLLPVAKKLLSGNGKTEKDVGAGEVEAMIASLANSTVPVALPETNVIQVTYFARTAEEAEQTLGLIVDQYLEQQANIQSGSTKLLKFYDQEKERVGAELVEAEEQLKKLQEKNNTVSVDAEIPRQLEMAAGREKALQEVEAEIEATRAKIASLKKQLSSQPERSMMMREVVRNPLVTKLKGDLVAAELALQDLLQRYTDKDRRVQEKREQIAHLKKELADAEKEEVIGRETTGSNPLREVMEKDLAAAQALLASLASQREIVRGQVRDASAVLAGLRGKKVETDRLSRVVDLRKEAVMLYGKKMEEARIAAGLGREQLANVAMIEKPHATLSTDLIKRIAMVLLAAIVGMGLGMGIAFGFEFFNNSLRTQEDVEYYLGLPVLAAIPDLQGRPLALES